MNVTEVRVSPASPACNGLVATAEILFDGCFLVKELKIIDKGGLLLQMPNRRITVPCPKCGCKNHLLANFCNKCGDRLPKGWPPGDPPPRLFADIAHPINQEFREMVEKVIFDEFDRVDGVAG